MMVSINGDTQSWMVYDGLLRENSIKIDDLEVHPFQETSIFRILKVDPFQHVHIQEAHRTDHIHTHFVVANFQSISKQFSKEGLIDTKISN